MVLIHTYSWLAHFPIELSSSPSQNVPVGRWGPGGEGKVKASGGSPSAPKRQGGKVSCRRGPRRERFQALEHCKEGTPLGKGGRQGKKQKNVASLWLIDAY